MLSKDEIIRLLQDRQPAVVAEACGLHKQTIWRIKVGQADDPSFSTMEKLSQYFENQQIKK